MPGKATALDFSFFFQHQVQRGWESPEAEDVLPVYQAVLSVKPVLVYCQLMFLNLEFQETNGKNIHTYISHNFPQLLALIRRVKDLEIEEKAQGLRA